MQRFRWKPQEEGHVAWTLAVLLSLSLGFQAGYLILTI